MIGVIDIGIGNIESILSAFHEMRVPAMRVQRAYDLLKVDRIIFPGVGSFDSAMKSLYEANLRDALELAVIKEHIPILGICVGMQVLCTDSDEGEESGLNWVPGHVRNFRAKPSTARLPLPHMGWNNMEIKIMSPLFLGLDNSSRFYYLHSYYFESDSSEMVLAKAHYGENFDCVIQRGNIYGVQFHPEKSHSSGMRLLKNFSLI